MAHAARLFDSHAGAPPSEGPWWLDLQGSDPKLLTDTMQTCFLQQLIPIPSLASLADKASRTNAKRAEQWLTIDDLEELYGQCGIPAQSVEPPNQPA